MTATLPQPALDRKAERQAREVERWSRDAQRMIDRKVDDAEAHAVKALTTTLKTTDEGRATIRKVTQSRSYQAAVDRLWELHQSLAGKSIDSLSGLIHDAREEFLAQSFAAWAGSIDPESIRASTEPTQAESKGIRRTALHGQTLYEEIGWRVENVIRHLSAAVAQAGNRDFGSRESILIIESWSIRAKRAIGSTVRLALSDSAVLADTAAQWLLIKPELRDDDPPPIEV